MVASERLRERHQRALTAVVEDGLRDDPGPGFPGWSSTGCTQLIPSDINNFSEQDLQVLSILTIQQTFDGGDRCVEFDDDGDGDARFWRPREKFPERVRGPHRRQ